MLIFGTSVSFGVQKALKAVHSLPVTKDLALSKIGTMFENLKHDLLLSDTDAKERKITLRVFAYEIKPVSLIISRHLSISFHSPVAIRTVIQMTMGHQSVPPRRERRTHDSLCTDLFLRGYCWRPSKCNGEKEGRRKGGGRLKLAKVRKFHCYILGHGQ